MRYEWEETQDSPPSVITDLELGLQAAGSSHAGNPLLDTPLVARVAPISHFFPSRTACLPEVSKVLL